MCNTVNGTFVGTAKCIHGHDVFRLNATRIKFLSSIFATIFVCVYTRASFVFCHHQQIYKIVIIIKISGLRFVVANFFDEDPKPPRNEENDIKRH